MSHQAPKVSAETLAPPLAPTPVSVGDNLIQKELSSDIVGISGSLLCLIHCVAPQLAAAGFSTLSAFSFLSHGYWDVILWLSCFAAVFYSARKSVFTRTAVLLWLSFILFSAGMAVESIFAFEHWVSYLGSASLISAHGYNFYKHLRWKQTVLSRIHICRV